MARKLGNQEPQLASRKGSGGSHLATVHAIMHGYGAVICRATLCRSGTA